MERNEWLLLGYKKIKQVLKCPPVPTQTKGGLCLIFLGVTRVYFPNTTRFLSIKFSLWIEITFSNWEISKSTDFWIHMLWQMRSILMTLALSGQMGLICRRVDSRCKKIVGDKNLWIPCSHWWNAWLLLPKIEYRFPLDVFSFVFILWPFWGQEKKKTAKGFRGCEWGQAPHALKKQQIVWGHRHC